MFHLPRGGNAGAQQVEASTANWEHHSTAVRQAYKSKGEIYCGALPYDDAWAKLEAILAHIIKLYQELGTRNLPPLKRKSILDALQSVWIGAQGADVFPIGVDDDRHLLTIAGARSGKGSSAIIPNLCLYSGSVVCLDPKGENASITAARRGQGDAWSHGMGQAVFVLDPFGIADVPGSLRAGLNPLALLDPASAMVVDDASLLAEGLIVSTDHRDSHWDETARNFVKGVILHLATTKPGATLFDLRQFLTQGDVEGWKAAIAADPDLNDDKEKSAFTHLLELMRKNSAGGNTHLAAVIAAAAESLAGTGSNEMGSILSTARRNTAFLDTIAPNFRATLSGAGRTFSPDVLKEAKQGATVYLCLPAERMGTHGRWLRLMIGIFLEHMQRKLEPPACGVPVLFLLEEFFTLGPMPAIEKAAGYAAGFGVKLWPILQDLSQLQALYPNTWQTFLANAGAIQIFGAADRATIEYASKTIGDIEITRVNVAHSLTSGESRGDMTPYQKYGHVFGGGPWKQMPSSFVQAFVRDKALDSESVNRSTTDNLSKTPSQQIVPLIRPDEIALHFSRESGAGLLLVKGQRPIWYVRPDYFASPWFQGLYTPEKKYRDKVPKGDKPEPWPLWQRKDHPFHAIAEALNRIAQAFMEQAEPNPVASSLVLGAGDRREPK